tara:strand:+ start:325 stop:429 length:105 start_codon:yes stop_codon:yes gene_type:complete
MIDLISFDFVDLMFGIRSFEKTETAKIRLVAIRT